MREPRLSAAARFHGHLGPWLVLGFRAGLAAARHLGGTPFDRRATVWCGDSPPCSCFLDGVQLGSGCTLGKRNIRHIRSDSCRARFGRGRRSYTLRLHPETRALLDRLAPGRRSEVEALARRLWRRPLTSLFLTPPDA